MFADCEQGLHDLPRELLATHKALGRLDQALAEVGKDRPDPNAEHGRLVAATRKAAAGGKPWPPVATIRETTDALADHETRRQVLDRARTETAGELVSAIADSAETIVVDYLRPAFDRVLATFTAAADLVPDGASTDALMRADDKTRKAWLTLDDAANVYARLIDTSSRLNRIHQPQHDHAGEFAAMTNVKDIWPEWSPGLTTPWQNTDRRIAWLALIRRGGKLWLPTSAERDAAWLDKYGDQLEQTRSNRFALEGFRALGG